MVGALGHHGGGILSLRATVAEYADAIESDLLRHGIDLWADLTTERLTWRRLKLWLTYSRPGDAFFYEYGGDEAIWDLKTRLLGLAVDALHNANYQRGGGKGKRPKSVLPGENGKKTKQIGGNTVVSIDEARRRLEARNGRRRSA